MKDKLTTIIGIGIAACVIFTFLFYLIAKDDIELFDIFTILIIAILVITSLYLIWDRVKNLKAGLTVQDERLKVVGYKAGYYGFIAAIWSAVGSNLGYNLIFDQELRGGLVTASVVLVSGIVFMILYIYYSRKGTLNENKNQRIQSKI
ncbi:MAG: hypothetical protein JSV67_03665 [Thermoplasmatales archaeon]|nr:MAG: hypothetical protein JSV67_03665 [Thermoplasmatales archaeon]